VPGKLRCDDINFNEPKMIQALIDALIDVACNESNVHRLEVRGTYYFSILDGPLASDAGWYLICDENQRPIYVGTATNLNRRLNTKDGSRDNFANPKRVSDDARNFIKAFVSLGVLRSLFVITISEPDVCRRIGVKPPLSKRDRENIEKVLSIFRVRIVEPIFT
jgi:hypothetical protein